MRRRVTGRRFSRVEPPSASAPKHYRDRCDGQCCLPSWVQFACLRVDLELHYGISLLVGDVEPLPTRVDGEVARKTVAFCGEGEHRERAGRGIDPIADDAVVAAVGGIEELARR